MGSHKRLIEEYIDEQFPGCSQSFYTELFNVLCDFEHPQAKAFVAWCDRTVNPQPQPQSFPARKPADASEVDRIVKMLIDGSNDSAIFGGIVYHVKRARGGAGGAFLTVLHTAAKNGGNTLSPIRCSKNTANAVLDAIGEKTQNVSVGFERF